MLNEEMRPIIAKCDKLRLKEWKEIATQLMEINPVWRLPSMCGQLLFDSYLITNVATESFALYELL